MRKIKTPVSVSQVSFGYGNPMDYSIVDTTGRFVSLREAAATINEQDSRIAELEAKLREAEGERDSWKRQHDLILSGAQKDNLRAEDADRYEQWLLDLGRISGCGHVDENLPRCIEQEFEKVTAQLSAAEAKLERVREKIHTWRMTKQNTWADVLPAIEEIVEEQPMVEVAPKMRAAIDAARSKADG